MRSTHLGNERQAIFIEKEWPVLYRFVAAIDEGFQHRLSMVLHDTLGKNLMEAFMGKPEMELAKFEALDRMEDTLSRWTQRLCSESPAICLEVNNFSGLPPQTIFARVVDATPLKQLLIRFRKLDMYLTGNDMPPIQSTGRFTINLSPRVQGYFFDELLYKTGKMEFHDTAVIKAIHLQQMKGGEWHAVRTFNLLSSTIELP
jgi:hypothetical protein